MILPLPIPQDPWRRLFVKVEDLMRTGENLPSVGPENQLLKQF